MAGMRIDELDEWQGVTPAMVREWLRKRGWSLHGEIWEKGRHNFADSLIDGNSDDVAFVIHCEEIAAGLTRQEALREINPRMRKGMPSEAARKACASWLVRDVETGEVELHRTEGTSLYSASDYKSGTLKTEAVPLRDFGDWVEFWPCDANGNKTRWPTDANGEMR